MIFSKPASTYKLYYDNNSLNKNLHLKGLGFCCFLLDMILELFQKHSHGQVRNNLQKFKLVTFTSMFKLYIVNAISNHKKAQILFTFMIVNKSKRSNRLLHKNIVLIIQKQYTETLENYF